jgi:CheY-like chemotaxis protein
MLSMRSGSAQPKLYPRTLIVDDNEDFASTFGRVLESLGCEVTAITDPNIALRTAESIKAELVFLDLRMPGLSGLDLARMLRKAYGWERMRIVAVTAHGSEEHRAATREAGFDAHVVKPVDMQLVESMLHTLFPHMRWMTRPRS